MAKADHIIALLKAHFENDPKRFSTVALQIAAYEARMGHAVVANNIKNIC